MLFISHYTSPIGKLLLAAREDTLTGLWIEGQKYYPGSFREEVILDSSFPTLQAAKDWLDRYFAGERPDITQLNLAPTGSNFRKQVWHILCRIPYGQVTTYGEIAAQIAAQRGLSAMSAQAIGGAVGHNPISIIIPCHRVVGADGSLTGYASGIDKKLHLLRLEQVDLSGLYRPVRGTAL